MKNYTILRSIAVYMLASTAVISLKAQSGFIQDGEKQRPSADSWEMVRYGETGASLHTGTISLRIPFYEYRDNDFDIPIRLDYSSNGCQPNIRAGVLGPDWTLTAGGSVCIDIRGLPDLQDVHNDIGGYYSLFRNETQIPSTSRIWRLGASLTNLVSTGSQPASLVHCFGGSPNARGAIYDAMPDFFHFRFPGHTGRFHLGVGRKVHVYNTGANNRDYRISFREGQTEDVQGIIIETADGYRYEFLEAETSSSRDNETVESLTTAYHLSTITAPNGRKAEYFYERHIVSSRVPAAVAVSGTQYLLLWDGSLEEADFRGKNLEHHISTVNRTVPLLSRIEIDGGAVISFSYTELPSGESDEYGAMTSSAEAAILNGRSIRMTGISVKTGNRTVRQCNLSYRRAASGKRINRLDEVDISGEGSYRMTYNEAGGFPGNGTLSVDHWGYYNGKNDGNSTNVPFLKITSNGKSSETITRSTRDADSGKSMTGILTRITYPTGGSSSFEYEGHDYSRAFVRDSLNHYEGCYRNISGRCGGVRITRIIHRDSDGAETGRSSYSYRSGNTSNGTLLDYPRYHIAYSAYATVRPSLVERLDYYSSSMTGCDGPHIEYSGVSETKGDGSVVRYTFSSSVSPAYADYLERRDTYSEPYMYGSIGGWSIDNADIAPITQPAVSLHGERGKLLQKSIYRSSAESTPVFTEQYPYNTAGEMPKDYYPVYIIRKISTVPVFTDNYRLKGSITTERRDGTEVKREESYRYNSHGGISTVTRSGSDNLVHITKTRHVTDLSAAETAASPVYRFMQRRFDISRPLVTERYVKRDGADSTLAGGERTTYGLKTVSADSLLVIDTIEEYDCHAGLWRLKERHLRHDNRGRLLEKEDAGGIKTSIVWGYGGLYPVLVGKNISIGTLKGVDGLQGIEDGPLSGCLGSTQQDAVRALCAGSNAEVEIFEYIPLVGLGRYTDATGRVFTYEYNNSGKLKRVTDSEGKSVEEAYYSPDNRLSGIRQEDVQPEKF